MTRATRKRTVLIVGDTSADILELTEVLKGDYLVQTATGDEAARESACAEALPDLVLLDLVTPGMDGYEICRRLQSDDSTRSIPVVFLGDGHDESEGLGVGAVDYLSRPFNPDLVKTRVRNHLELRLYRDGLDDLVRERTRELELMQEVTVESLGTLAEFRDPETGGHIKRTQAYVKALAEKLSAHLKYRDYLGDRMVHLLYLCAPLHDIGKVGVPDSILLKPGKLTEEEFEIMKQHTVLGRDALTMSAEKLDNDFFKIAREIAYSHQEKWNGSGYPEGLKGEDIPLSGRLMAVADVYDALISKRVYKDPLPHEKAVKIIQQGSGAHFDPDVVDAFMQLQDAFKEIAMEFADFNEEREQLSAES